MKKILFLFLILTLNINAQWNNISSNTTNHLRDIVFTSATTGYIVGDNGTILKTTDSGNTWNSIYSDVSKNFKSIIFIDDNYGFAITQNQLLKTINGGLDWSINYTNTITLLNAVYFISNNIGFIGCDDQILKTIDGGLNWTSYQTNNPINSISFPTLNTGYFVGGSDVSSVLYKTTNQGISYSTQNILMQCVKEKVSFISENIGYIIGWYSPLIKKTINGGSTWDTLGNFEGGMDINFINEQFGYYLDNAGGFSKVYNTINGGSSWINELSISTNTSLYGFAKIAIKNNFAVVVGENGLIYKKENILSNNNFKKKENLINIYPNPINDGFMFINYDINEIKINSVSIVNILGEVIIVLKDDFDAINANSFSDGIYLLKFDTTKGIITKKIIRK